jgi:ABC-type transport system involved in multi-copper enzyme maturation permease subunit
VNAAVLIARELRAESRRAANYWLRVLAAGVLILEFASIMLGAQLDASQVGAALFMGLNQTMLFAVWVLVPLMTADCVSREKREGTLGLLFLTPLTVFDVIAGKAAIHVLRALTLYLAALPLMGLPLFLGGVDWRWVFMAVVVQANAVLLAIAAGIYASTRGGTTIQVMVLAEGCALGLAVLSRIAAFLIAVMLVRPRAPGWYGGYMGGMSVLLALTLFFLILKASVRRLRATWDDESSGHEQPRWVKLFSNSAFWQDFFRWNTSRTLDRNPMAWLQEYSWTARLTKWGWLVVVLLTEFVLLSRFDRPGPLLSQPLITVVLTLSIAFSAVGSFRRELDSGLLELLLVTPLSVRKLLGGRLWGIGCHYLPALGILWVGSSCDRILNPKAYNNPFIAAMLPHPLALIAMIALGLYLALSRLNFFLAWFLTWIIAYVVPILARVELGRFAGTEPRIAFWFSLILQLGLAGLMWDLLQRKMCRREFVVAKSERHLLV